MAAGLVDGEASILSEHQVPTPKSDDPEVLFDALSGVVHDVQTGAIRVPELCGVGCGGPMTRGGETVSPLNIPAWRGFELRRRLVEATGLPVAVDNDAKALALGEGWVGAARGRGELPGHGGLDRNRWGHRPRWRAARRPQRQCRPYRTRHRGALWSSLPVWGPRMSRSGGFGTIDRRLHRQGPGRSPPGGQTENGHVGRACRGLSGEPARPSPRRGGRFGGLGLRRPLLCRRPGGNGRTLPAGVLPRRPHRFLPGSAHEVR